VASRGGQIVHLTDPYLQAREVLLIIAEALAQAGATPEHVVRTRIYITDLAHFDEVGRAHGEVFGSIRPATSMVQVAGLVGGALVEIEAEAYVE
jgi:enamine deaminase RidA (YjgF/YER057c/UK114 family)